METKGHQEDSLTALLSRFRQFLLHKAREHGSTVLLVNEAHKDILQVWQTEVSGSEVYNCTYCGLKIDRDTSMLPSISSSSLCTTTSTNPEWGSGVGPSSGPNGASDLHLSSKVELPIS